MIKKSYLIALKYLHFHRLKISKLILNQDLTLQKLAVDCIAVLLFKENNSELISLQKTFKNWGPAVATDDDCLFFLNKIVASW